MEGVATIISLLNFLGLGGLGVFLYYVIKGLQERIATLTELAREQKETLEAVRSRATELDKLSKDYKQALLDFQDMGKRLDERRNELVTELELANKRKDGELARLAHLELEEIELKKKSLERLPDLERRLTDTVAELGRQMRIVSPGLLLAVTRPSQGDSWRKWLSHYSSWENHRADNLYLFLSAYMHQIAESQPKPKAMPKETPEQARKVDEKKDDDAEKFG